jgi:hypothetical protein
MIAFCRTKKITMKISATKGLMAAGALLIAGGAFAQVQKNKFLENKKYDVQFYEMKASGRGKSVPSKVYIKGGKISADLMEEKLQLPPMTYKVTLDSTYTEDETEMHMVTFEAVWSEGKEDYKWEGTVINYDIEGTCVQSKGGVDKKKFEFSGGEKTKK